MFLQNMTYQTFKLVISHCIVALGCWALLRFKVQRTDKYKEENGLSKEILPKYFVQYNSNIKSHFKHCVAKIEIVELGPHVPEISES